MHQVCCVRVCVCMYVCVQLTLKWWGYGHFCQWATDGNIHSAVDCRCINFALKIQKVYHFFSNLCRRYFYYVVIVNYFICYSDCHRSTACQDVEETQQYFGYTANTRLSGKKIFLLIYFNKKFHRLQYLQVLYYYFYLSATISYLIYTCNDWTISLIQKYDAIFDDTDYNQNHRLIYSLKRQKYYFI